MRFSLGEIRRNRPTPLRAYVIVSCLGLVVSSCQSSTQPTTQVPSTVTVPSTTAPIVTQAGSTTTASPSTTTSTVQPLPSGLVTATGVTVAVVGVSDRGFRVISPCGALAVGIEGEPIPSTDVVLDPGHGGPRDIGAVGENGLPEKELNLLVAGAAKKELEQRGMGVVLTRTDDYGTPLEVRANLADSLGAAVMVSIHHNGPTPGPSDLPGVEVFVQKDSVESQRLGGLVHTHAVAALSNFDIEWSAARDAGVFTVLNSSGDDAYGIIRRPSTPTALVELGYLSNPTEARLFATPEYVEAAATALADSIEEFLSGDNLGTEMTEGRVFDPNPGLAAEACDDPPLG